MKDRFYCVAEKDPNEEIMYKIFSKFGYLGLIKPVLDKNKSRLFLCSVGSDIGNTFPITQKVFTELSFELCIDKLSQILDEAIVEHINKCDGSGLITYQNT